MRSNRPSRIEEGRDPEPPADDDPEIGFERRLDTGEAGAAGSGEGSERSAGDESGGSAGSAEERTPRREGG
nr:hypothetical protein GCM10020241_16180 [Streptoalloteichus tenebrarius]